MKLSQEKIISLRTERGWSQEKLAIIAGLGERTIQRIEKEGNASLESVLALASAFELTPKDLQQEANQELSSAINTKDNISQAINWGGIISSMILVFCGVIAIQLTAKYKTWEMISAGLIVCLPLLFLMLSFGFHKTKALIMATAWLVRMPKHYENLNLMVMQSKSLIDYIYIVGGVSTLVCGLTITVHTAIDPDHVFDYLNYVIRPFVYAIFVAELWVRPLKKRIEFILHQVNGGAK